MIARALPGRDPAYVQGRAAYLSYCEERAVDPPKSGTRRHESLTDNGQPIAADYAAVTIAAGHPGRIALISWTTGSERKTRPGCCCIPQGCRLFQRHGDAVAPMSAFRCRPIPRKTGEAQAFAQGLAQEALRAVKAAE